MDKHVKKCYGANAKFAENGNAATLTIGGGSITFDFAAGSYKFADIENMFATKDAPAKFQNTFTMHADKRGGNSREVLFASGIFDEIRRIYEDWQN